MKQTVIFDLGGVLIDWNPRYLYRRLMSDEAEVERFLATVCTPEWNEEQDAGRALAEGTRLLVARHPQHAAHIAAFYDRWIEMLGEAIGGTVEILDQLDRAGHPLYALTNWSAELFHHARERFDFLARFRAIVVSGEEKLKKPDPRLFRVLLERHAIDPATAIYVDDSPRNVEAAAGLGLTALRFRTPEALRAELGELGLLGVRAAS